MYAIVYLLRGFGLVWYCVSPSYRAKSHARWKKMPNYRVVFEVGCGLVGLLILYCFFWMIFDSLNNSTPKLALPKAALEPTPFGAGCSAWPFAFIGPQWLSILF